MKKILLIDDEPQIRRYINKTLLVVGFDVYLAPNGKEGLRLCNEDHPDLILLDLGLPDIDGQDLLVMFKKNYPELPIIVLSARDQTDEIVQAINSGANDYIKKPFDTPELIARINRHISLSKSTESIQNEARFSIANLSMSIEKHEVKIDDEVIHLSKKEFQILHYMFQQKGKIITQNQLLKEVWGNTFSDEVQYLRVYIGQLRKKLKNCSIQPLITTESGVGYYFGKVS